MSKDFYGNVIPKNVIIEIYNYWKEGHYWKEGRRRTSPCGNCTHKTGSWLRTRCEKYGHRSDWDSFRHLCPDCRDIILESEKQGGE